MACNDETCLPPERVSFSFGKKDITMPAETATEVTAAKQEEPATAQPEEAVAAREETAPATGGENNVRPTAPEPNQQASSDQLTDAKALWAPVTEQLKAFGDSTISAVDTSWLFIFFAGFLGGLIALLTPCVWPMIPMTVSFFLKRTQNRKKAIHDAITYGLSIIVIYLAMGLLITGIFGASALNDLSTNAVFNLLFFLLLVLFCHFVFRRF